MDFIKTIHVELMIKPRIQKAWHYLKFKLDILKTNLVDPANFKPTRIVIRSSKYILNKALSNQQLRIKFQHILFLRLNKSYDQI